MRKASFSPGLLLIENTCFTPVHAFRSKSKLKSCLSQNEVVAYGLACMKVSTEKIKARGAQFQEEGVRVRAALELNAGMKEPLLRSGVKISKSLTIGVQVTGAAKTINNN